MTAHTSVSTASNLLAQVPAKSRLLLRLLTCLCGEVLLLCLLLTYVCRALHKLLR